MPFTNGLASFFHFGAKTWRPKTAEQSYLEFEKQNHVEEVQRKQSEVQKKIQLLDHIRKLEAKTQALNQMALSAEIQTKEHELIMRERQMAESRQIELAKLELAKRMGQESLDEADLSRIRRERMKAELLAHASNNHAMNELNCAVDLSEIDDPTIPHLPQPPSFTPSERFMSPHPGHMPIAGPIPQRGMSPMTGAYGSLPRSDPRFMATPMSTPGYIHMPPGGRHSIFPPGGRHSVFDFQGGIPNGPHLQPRRMSDSFPDYPGAFDQGPGDFDRDFENIDRAPMDFQGGGRGPSRNAFYGSNPIFPDHFDHRQMHPANSSLFDTHEPISTQMTLRAHAERLWRKRLERLDQKSRQHNLNAQALRELRKRELIATLMQRGAHQREIEAQAAKLAEHDHSLNEAQLRELREKEYHLMLKAKGLQEREIAEQIRTREEGDREILLKELQRLEREQRRKEVLEAEWAIRRALEKGEGPPLGVARPTMEEIQSEGLLEDYMDGFHDLNHRLQHEILSISAHHRPHSRMSGMNETNQPGTSRASGRSGDHEPVSRSSSRSRRSLREGSSPDQVRYTPSHRTSPRSLATEDREYSSHYIQPGPSNPRKEASIHDATLAARLQSAAVNSAINGGKRSRASSDAGPIPDDYVHSSRHRPGGDLNSFNSRGEGRSRSSTNADLMRSYPNFSRSESELAGGQRSSRNGTPQSFETGPHSRLNNEHYNHPAIGRSPLRNSQEFYTNEDARQTMKSRPQSQVNESRNRNDAPHGLSPENISRLSTEEIEMLLGGHGLDPAIDENLHDAKNLSQEEIARMSAEEFDAMLAQHQANYLATGMSNLNVGNSQSHRMGGLSRHTSVSGTRSSSSLQRQPSFGRVPSESSRSLSRGTTSRSHQSVSNRQDSRANSRPASALDRPNDRPPSASRSLHRNSGQHSLAGDRTNDNSYPDDRTRDSIYDSLNHPAHNLDGAETNVTVTEMKEQPGATIVKRLGRIQANSRSDLNHSQQIDTGQSRLSERNEMHQAVKNLTAEASRSGANGIVSLRIHDLEDGSYDASGEAVLLMQH